VPSAARWRGAAVSASRRVSHVILSSIVTSHVKGIIGRSTKNDASTEPPNYAMRRCFKDPPPKEDCPICFLPMSEKLIYCVSLPPATISSVPIHTFAHANKRLALEDIERYYSCLWEEYL
jgi:hypothetical protein